MLVENGYNMQNSSTNIYKYTYITQQCIFFSGIQIRSSGFVVTFIDLYLSYPVVGI